MAHPQKELIDAIHIRLIGDANVTAIIPAADIHKGKTTIDLAGEVGKFVNVKEGTRSRTTETGGFRAYDTNINVEIYYDNNIELDSLDILNGSDVIEESIASLPRPIIASGSAFLIGIEEEPEELETTEKKKTVLILTYDTKKSKT
jgi:hypothetical protein